MGHKVNPFGIRLGITSDWRAKWYAKPRDYAKVLYPDLQLRRYLEKGLRQAGVSTIQIERLSQQARIIAFVARPGMIIGKKGELIERFKQEAARIIGMPVNLMVQELRKPELDAKLIAENIAGQLMRRVLFRRAMKRAVSTAVRAGAKGIKVMVAGRLGGAEIARTESYQEGRMPLHTFRAEIGYGTAEAKTSYGVIGIKVWILKGEVFTERKREIAERSPRRMPPARERQRSADAKKDFEPRIVSKKPRSPLQTVVPPKTPVAKSRLSQDDVAT